MATALGTGARHDDTRIRVIRKGCGECHGAVARVAFNRDVRMSRGTENAGGADRDRAVVAAGAASGDTRVIECSVRIQIDPRGSRVTVAALLCGDDVVRRFANGDDAVVASAA